MDSKIVESIESLSSKEMISISSEVVDFRGIGKVEKDFIPLLEEVCSLYPSLIDTKKKRSQRFMEWAFTALGRVLHFLNTKKEGEMDDDACNYLQTLWEELEICGFDLSWLKPRIDRALEMKKLEKDMTILEMEAKTLMTKMIEAKVNLEITRLVKVKESFEECDLDDELRYDLVRRMSHQEMLEDAFEISAVRATETVKDKVEHLKEKLAMVQSDLDEALKVNSKLNIKLQDLTIAHADCEKKQKDVATRFSETVKLSIEAGRKLQKNNEDLTLECQIMKKTIKDLVAHNNKLIQEKAKLVRERNARSAEVDGLLGC
ncbi:hypothetical protein V8G54_030191 [Vigna mungo]|uniref:Uncharacterized protein n=1 Tax=Vigna mungo TaxID=3915 RepID=A0AAQ3MWC8_VIGMU